DEVAEIMNGILDELIELGMRLRRDTRAVADDEVPQRIGGLWIRRRTQREQHRKRDWHVDLRGIARMNVPDRVGQPLPRGPPPITVEKLMVLIDVSRKHIAGEPLGGLRLAVHE